MCVKSWEKVTDDKAALQIWFKVKQIKTALILGKFFDKLSEILSYA